MKVLVTGGAGFIGSNFIHKYIDICQILNYDKLTYAGNLENLKLVESHKNYNFIQGDIKDEIKLKNIFQNYQPDAIINFAAESHVDKSIDGPRDFIESNIAGTYQLLQESLNYFNGIKNSKKRKFRYLQISTDEVYGSLGSLGKFKETTSYNPSSPYSASKASADHLVRAWFHTYKLPILITSCSNNYGPYQYPEKLIPLIISNCLQHKELPVYGNGNNIRDWIYVKDHCSAIFKVLKEGKIGETYNIGGGQEMKNIDIVNSICSILDNICPSKKLKTYKSLIVFVKDRPGHDFRYAIDSTKIENQLNFYPLENIESGLNKTIKWYLDNSDWMKKINLKHKV
tara:strand:+ start:1494 stop:2519 length:1026 start_codon:yes stop_codon:yes gene_type:complete